MKNRTASKINTTVSEIGFGAWQLGSEGDFWNQMDKQSGIQLVQEAVKNGVTFFDTAPGYSGGNSELILGEALQGMRHQVHINTKIGHGPNGEYEFSVEGIKTSIHRSLKKLQTDYLDTVILHNPEQYILKGETDLFDELENYKQKGIIKGYGVSIDSYEELKTVLEHLDVDVIEIMFNMIHQEPRFLFDEVKKRGILLIVKIPFDSGWLTGRFDEHTEFTGIRSRWNQDVKNTRSNIVQKIKQVFNKDIIVAEALAYILSYDAVTTVIPGTRTIKHLMSNIAAADTKLSESQIQAIEDLYTRYIKNQDTPW